MIVVDANIAVGWCIAGHPLTAASIALRRAHPVIIAPDLLIAEVTNALARLAIATPQAVSEIESGLEQLPRWFTELAPSVRLRSPALRLAVQLQHSAYDCFYLALAIERDCQFATADQRFVRRLLESPHAPRIIVVEPSR